MKAWISLLGLGTVVLAPFGCETKGGGDGVGGASVGTGGETNEYAPIEPGSDLSDSCSEPSDIRDKVVLALACQIGPNSASVQATFDSGNLRVYSPKQVGEYGGPGSAVVLGVAIPCSASSIRNRTPCTIELAEYTRAENPIDGMAGASGTAIEVGSAVTMLVDCPEGLSIDRGDDWSPLPVSLEPKKFSIHAENCEVTW